MRRDKERLHCERMSRLFKPRRPWQKKEILGLGEAIFLIDGRGWLLTKLVSAVLFLIYGPGIFPEGFVKVRYP